jgi:hypothetical protein
MEEGRLRVRRVEVEVVEVEKQEEEGLMKVKDESRFFP